MSYDFFQAAVDRGYHLLASGVYLHFRLLCCRDNLVSTVLVLVIVEVRPSLIFCSRNNLVREVLNRGIFGLSEDRVVLVRL